MDPDLTVQLQQARHATNFFGRALTGLSDSELGGASLLTGWTRSHVVAHVASNAGAIGRLSEWARTGVETPMYESVDVRNREIVEGASLSPAALRSFFEDSAKQLEDAWNAVPADAWAHSVRTMQGRVLALEGTVWMRARELWVHAVDLADDSSFTDVPSDALDQLLRDIVEAWESRGDAQGVLLSVTDSEHPLLIGDTAHADGTQVEVVSGTRGALAQWATGRGTAGVSSTLGEVRAAPRWL